MLNKQVRAFSTEGGGIGLFITLVPKVIKNVFLFVVLTTLGTLLNFDSLVHLVESTTTNI